MVFHGADELLGHLQFLGGGLRLAGEVVDPGLGVSGLVRPVKGVQGEEAVLGVEGDEVLVLGITKVALPAFPALARACSSRP